MSSYREDFKNGKAPVSTAPAPEEVPDFDALREEMEASNQPLPTPKRVELEEDDEFGFGNDEEFAALFPPTAPLPTEPIVPTTATATSFYGPKKVDAMEEEEDFFGDEDDDFFAELDLAIAAPKKIAVKEPDAMEVEVEKENDGFNSDEEAMLREMDEMS